jgi:hypothetical protein
MKKYAQGSKDVVRLSGKKAKLVGKSEFLNQRSIDDLTKIRDKMRTSKIKIEDLQFLINKDGTVVISDPLNVSLGEAPSPNNIRMIDLLIESAKSNLKN